MLGLGGRSKKKLSEAEAADAVRARLEPGLLSPGFDHHWNFVRFLEVGGWDEKKTARRLSEHLRVRRFLQLDEEGSEPPQPIPAYLERWPGGCLATEPGGTV